MPDRARTALITGAAGGIGTALVAAFRDAGYRVIATDLLEAVDLPPSVSYLPIDLERYASDTVYADAAVASITAELGDGLLDVLVNNAAIQLLGGVEQVTRESWRRSLDVNLTAPFLLIQSLLGPLERTSGCAINVSSIHARLTKKNFVAYATTKAALSGMTRAMAVDLGPRIRINAIEPAAIETPMLRAGFAGQPDQYRQLEACHPQQRIGKPDEVARLAVLIAENRLGFLHGACIGLDGGISHRLFDPS